MVSVDPSIGSRSSQPGWAVYQEGVLRDSGTFAIDPEESVPLRLQELARLLRNLYAQWHADILCYEQLPSSAQGWNANGYASLLKALGVILSVKGPRSFVGIHPKTWKRLVRAEYVKSDENDAVEMGYIVIQIAKDLEENPPEEAKRSRKRKKALPSEE